MSKGSRKAGRKTEQTPAGAARPTEPAGTVPASGAVAVASAESSWLDSTDPRRRLAGRIILTVVWLYVAALWLLALDQTFNWGIFGPKLPPIP